MAESLYEVKGFSKSGIYAELVMAESPYGAKKLAEPKIRMMAKGKAILKWVSEVYMDPAELARFGG
jgi:hypothetical protein